MNKWYKNNISNKNDNNDNFGKKLNRIENDN